jgi:hypothetical protein
VWLERRHDATLMCGTDRTAYPAGHRNMDSVSGGTYYARGTHAHALRTFRTVDRGIRYRSPWQQRDGPARGPGPGGAPDARDPNDPLASARHV